jgi:hypothetical protein
MRSEQNVLELFNVMLYIKMYNHQKDEVAHESNVPHC